MKLKTFLLILTLISVCLSASALSLEELLGSAQAIALCAGEKPILVQTRNPRPQLLPRHQLTRELIETVLRDIEPAVMVETLHIYEKPAAATAWSAEEKTQLYNNLLALSTLTGLQYYSASRGAMRTFYETSFVIDGPSGKKPIPDPVYTRPPSELTIYARQKDLTFGDNTYQYNYISAPGAIIFTQQNLTSLTYGIIQAVGKNRLRSTVAVLDADEYLLVYAVSMAKTASLPAMRDRIGNSFANRAEAILHWFSDQADKVFKSAN